MANKHSFLSTAEYLGQIDTCFEQYADILVNKDFTNTRTLTHLTFSDVPEILIGVRRLLIHEVSKLRSPHMRYLMGHKDDSSFDQMNIPSSTSVNVESPIVISDSESGSNSMSMNLQPKQLFPSDMSNVTTPIGTNSSINSYEHQLPMEKHLSKLLVEISDKEIEYQKLKSEVDSVLSNDASATDNVAVTSGCSHGSNLMKRRCIDPPCATSILCGKLKLHKNELKSFDMKKAQMKKLLKEKLSLESECKKCRETIVAMVKSFPQAVKTSLINSNKRAYLTIHDGKFVPLTAKINRDISILQKYYSGKVPNDLEQESALFPAIIEEASKEFKLNSVTVEQKLEERLSSVHRRITVNKLVGVMCNSQLITIDSSPKPHTSTSNCGGNCVNPPFPNQYSFNPFIPAPSSLATGSTSTCSVPSNNLSIDFLPNARDPTVVGNGSDLYGQFNQSCTSSDHNDKSSYYRNIKPLSFPLMWLQWGTFSGMTVPNTPQPWVPMLDTSKFFAKCEPTFDTPTQVVKNEYQPAPFNSIRSENPLPDTPVTQCQTDTKVDTNCPVAVSQCENVTTLTD